MASLGLQGVILGKPVRTTVSDKADCRRRRGALGVVSAVECDAEVDGFKLPQPTPRLRGRCRCEAPSAAAPT
jgi:hypothetical protein